jgi:hypothetical protein
MEMGLAKTTKEITDQDKVLARNALILEQTTLQQGDFARTADGAANQQRILAAEIENSKAAIGEGLLPAYKDLLGELVKVADWAGKNSDTIRNLGVAVGVLSAAVITLNIAFKVATISVQAFTIVAATLQLGYLTLAAATGSATAAQALAELTYKNSRVAAILYTAAMEAQNVVTIALTGGIRALTVALLANPFTAVAVAAAGLITVLYKLYETTKLARQENEKLAATISATRKETEEDVLSAKRHVAAREGLVTTTDALTTSTTNYSGASDKLAEAARKAAEKLAKQKEILEATKKAFADYANGVKSALTAQFNFQSAFENKGKGSFLEALKKQASAAIAFTGKIAKLVSLGISRGGIDQILAAGPVVGGQIADELLTGGAQSISEVNRLVASVNNFAGITSDAVSSALGGTTGTGGINITINGAIDPEGVRRSLEALFQRSGARIGAVNLASSAL